jgi:hypothetical protein
VEDDHRVEGDLANPLSWPTENRSWQSNSPGRLDSTWRSEKAGLTRSISATRLALSSIGSPPARSSSLSNRSYLVAIPCLARMFWIVGGLTPMPSSLSIALGRQQPNAGCSSESATMRSKTAGAVASGRALWTGGRSFELTRPCV